MLQDQRKRPHIQIRDQSGKNLSDTKIGKQEKDWQGCVTHSDITEADE